MFLFLGEYFIVSYIFLYTKIVKKFVLVTNTNKLIQKDWVCFKLPILWNAYNHREIIIKNIVKKWKMKKS